MIYLMAAVFTLCAVVLIALMPEPDDSCRYQFVVRMPDCANHP